MDMDPRLTAVRPTARQIAWQKREFYAFIHFGMNTATNREWGLGDESPALFEPTDLDTDQWARAIKSAGMTGAILTAKHHDGFCLWPSAYTDHSVACSPLGRDVVAELAESLARHDLALGIYLSPWDRHDRRYGSGKPYDDYFVAQLEELLTGYGPVFSVWFDGAYGGEPDRAQRHDWERYYQVVRRLQPDAVIAVCGPDVRWCGNEAGHTRQDEWSVVPRDLQDAERTVENSQHVDDGVFATLVRSESEDLGSRDALAGHLDDLVWYPAEVNTSIRPGWFYHPDEDDAVRGVQELFDIWTSSTGRNATFLLNVPPTPGGLIAEPDRLRLAELGQEIARFRGRVLDAEIGFSSGEQVVVGEGTGPGSLRAAFGPTRARWQPSATDPCPSITLDLGATTLVEAVVLSEDISLGQRIERVTVLSGSNGEDREIASCGSIGYRRILRFEPQELRRVKIVLSSWRGLPALSAAAVIGAR